MRPSDIPPRYKITMLAAFIAIMATWSWLVMQAVYVWLPETIIVPVGFAVSAWAAWYWFREWLRARRNRSAVNRHIVREHDIDP